MDATPIVHLAGVWHIDFVSACLIHFLIFAMWVMSVFKFYSEFAEEKEGAGILSDMGMTLVKEQTG